MNGKFFVADSNNSRILIWNTTPANENTPADVVVGQTNFENSTNSCSSSRLTIPYGVYSDGTKLFVADTLNNRVLIWNTIPTTNGVAANVVIGQNSFTSCTANHGLGSDYTDKYGLSSPYKINIKNGKLIIADRDNNRTLVYNTIPTTNYAAADVVIGQPNFENNDPNFADGYHLSSVAEISSDQNGRFYVLDQGYNRLLIWNSTPTTPTQMPDIYLGQPTQYGVE